MAAQNEGILSPAPPVEPLVYRYGVWGAAMSGGRERGGEGEGEGEGERERGGEGEREREREREGERRERDKEGGRKLE